MMIVSVNTSTKATTKIIIYYSVYNPIFMFVPYNVPFFLTYQITTVCIIPNYLFIINFMIIFCCWKTVFICHMGIDIIQFNIAATVIHLQYTSDEQWWNGKVLK